MGDAQIDNFQYQGRNAFSAAGMNTAGCHCRAIAGTENAPAAARGQAPLNAFTARM
jgi:hypothetical protein